MEFREFSNPEEADYDIMRSLEDGTTIEPSNNNQFEEEQMNLIGILEDVSDAELLATYGITAEEYFKPTKASVDKIRKSIGAENTPGKSK